MKSTHLFAALLVASTGVFATIPARASDEPKTGEPAAQVARLDSSAPPPVIAATACSLQPLLIADGRARRLDIQVDGRRCSSTPAPDGAIPLSVRIEHDPTQQVVVEASVPSDVSSELIRAAVLDVQRELGRRLAPSELVVAFQPPENATWNDARLEPQKEPFSPAMMGVGIASIVVGGVTMMVGSLAVFCTQCGGLPEVLAIGGLLTATAVGIPLLVVGHHKVTRVTAGLSPTGGSLRVTF